MTALTFHPPTPAAISHIAANLRQADRVELAVTSPGQALEDALQDSVLESRWSIAAHVDGVPAILYGVAPSADPHIGHPWMLATEDLRKVRREFLVRCAAEVRLMQQRFAVLTNQVHRDNALAIRWLEWLGFTINRERPAGPHGELFVFWKGAVRRV